MEGEGEGKLASNRKQIKCIAYLHSINCHLHCVQTACNPDVATPSGYPPIKPSECLTDYLSLCMSACHSLSLSPSLYLALSLSLSVCPLHSVVCVPSPRFVCTVNQYACKSAPSGPLATGYGYQPCPGTLLQRRCTFYHNLPSASAEFEAADAGMRHIVCRLLWHGIQVWFACRTRLHRLEPPPGQCLSSCLSVCSSICLAACVNYTCKALCTQRWTEKLKLFTQDINVVPIYCRRRLRIVTTNCF